MCLHSLSFVHCAVQLYLLCQLFWVSAQRNDALAFCWRSLTNSFDLDDSVQFAKYFVNTLFAWRQMEMCCHSKSARVWIQKFTWFKSPPPYLAIYWMDATWIAVLLFQSIHHSSQPFSFIYGIVHAHAVVSLEGPKWKLFLKMPLIQRIYFKCKLCK